MGLIAGNPRFLCLMLCFAVALSLGGCFAGNLFGGGLPAIVYVVSDDDGAQAWVQQPGGDEPSRISSLGADARTPRWSPDQNKIAWISVGNKTQLMLYDVDGEGVTSLASNVDADQPPIWAPESDRIAYVSDQDGDPDVYMVALEGEQKTRLTFSPERELVGDWSPDGEWLVFTEHDRDGLFLRNPNGVNRIELTSEPDTDPVWSPKGDRIAFLRSDDGARDVYVLRPTNSDNWADDTDEVAVSDDQHDEFSVAWSADGRRLAFVVRFDDQSEIFSVLVDGSERRQLTQNTEDDLMPVWSAGEDRIAFVSHAYGNAEILYMNADGTEQMRLTFNDAMDTHPDW
jgi:TolB protein